MKPIALAILAAALAVTMASPAAAAPAPTPPDRQAVTRGQAAFTQLGCYQCHGYVGQGGMAGAALAPNPLPLSYYQAYVRNPRGQMPPYSRAILSDPQLADIHAFLRSIPAGKPAEEIPLLSGR
jgi:ubiquinol-cytochrome c reductase cytochrome c subunit